MALETDLAHLQQRRQHLHHMDGLSDKARAFCAQVADQLEEFDFDQKRLAFQALRLRVVVGRGAAKLFGAIPTNLATTA